MNISKQYVVALLLAIAVMPMEAADGRRTKLQRAVGLLTEAFLGNGHRATAGHVEDLVGGVGNAVNNSQKKAKVAGNALIVALTTGVAFGGKVLRTSYQRPPLGNPFLYAAGVLTLVAYDKATPQQRTYLKGGLAAGAMATLAMNCVLAAQG